MNADFVLYQAVTDAEQMRSVLLRHVTSGAEVLIRSDGVTRSLPVVPGLSDAAEMMVSESPDSEAAFASNQKVSVWFDSHESGYFFECQPRRDGGFFFLHPGPCLYQQQRRGEFRYVIPVGYRAIFVGRVEGQPQWQVRDINLSGLGISVPGEWPFAIDTRVDGDLWLGERPSIALSAKVRRLRAVEGAVEIGFEFDHVVYRTESDLAESLLYLRHDVYYLNRTNS